MLDYIKRMPKTATAGRSAVLQNINYSPWVSVWLICINLNLVLFNAEEKGEDETKPTGSFNARNWELPTTVTLDFQTTQYLENQRLFLYDLGNKKYLFLTIQSISVMNRPGTTLTFLTIKFWNLPQIGYRFQSCINFWIQVLLLFRNSSVSLTQFFFTFFHNFCVNLKNHIIFPKSDCFPRKNVTRSIRINIGLI